MIYKRFLLVALLVAAGFVLAPHGVYNAPVATAHQETKTDTTTGYPTGTICKKSGTYRASNKYLEVIIVVVEGETFPPFTDGTNTIWYRRIAKN